MYLTITVRARDKQWSGPYGDAEMVLQVRREQAATLECVDALQKTIQVAVDELDVKERKEEKDESADDGA